jgi:hypothetical protein
MKKNDRYSQAVAEAYFGNGRKKFEKASAFAVNILYTADDGSKDFKGTELEDKIKEASLFSAIGANLVKRQYIAIGFCMGLAVYHAIRKYARMEVRI